MNQKINKILLIVFLLVFIVGSVGIFLFVVQSSGFSYTKYKEKKEIRKLLSGVLVEEIPSRYAISWSTCLKAASFHDELKAEDCDREKKLVEMGNNIVPTLIEIFNETKNIDNPKSNKIRYAALQVLGQIQNRQAVDFLNSVRIDNTGTSITRAHAKRALEGTPSTAIFGY